MGPSTTARVAEPKPSAEAPTRAAAPRKTKAVAPKGAAGRATRKPPSGRPRDASRLGLPAGARVVLADPDAGPNGPLLLVAALLLAAAAGGSAVLGVAARQATRHA